MGIKHFFKWLRTNFPGSVNKLTEGIRVKASIDNFMIDLNGLFHNSAQRVYEYGEFKPPQRLIGPPRPHKESCIENDTKVFEGVCARIRYLVSIARPKKRLVLCIDGPAPLSKQNQQRQRRFRSAQDRDNLEFFDSNCMTPGTRFMMDLSNYIEVFFQAEMKINPEWESLEIVWSNERVPGEGEQKLVSYIRKYGDPTETFCIHGADADIIMLSLATHFPNFYVLRDDLMSGRNEFFLVNIGQIRDFLSKRMKWTNSNDSEYIARSAINDFILMCFLVGNDFLPHIPSIEIIQGSIDLMLDLYKEIGEHLTVTSEEKRVSLVYSSFQRFLTRLSDYEKPSLEAKLENTSLFPSPLLQKHSYKVGDGAWEIDIQAYRKLYYSENLPGEKKQICHEYIEGLEWVLSYYTSGVPSWRWLYKHHYAPFSHDLAKYIKSYTKQDLLKDTPVSPFVQLLSVLPPKSSGLLPKPLGVMLTHEKSPLTPYCPTKLKIDRDGVRQDWEAVVILPFIPIETTEACVARRIERLEEVDTYRNKFSTSRVYTKMTVDEIVI